MLRCFLDNRPRCSSDDCTKGNDSASHKCLHRAFIALQVFCGKIPKDIYEDELIPHFEKCGKIWDLRLMMDPMTGLNRSESAVTMLSLLINIACIQGLRFHHLHHQGRGSRGCQTGKVDFQFVKEPTGTNPFSFWGQSSGKVISFKRF